MNAVAPLVLQKDLTEPTATYSWPTGSTWLPFSANTAEQAHKLLSDAYENGFGDVGAFDDWHKKLTADPEYDPDLCFLRMDTEANVLAFAQCWTGAFVKDLAVAPNYRGKGAGTAMLGTIFEEFQRRGATTVQLKAVPGNIHAIALYRRCGMREPPGN